MKKVYCILLLSYFVQHVSAQTNSFPPTGATGIGTTTPDPSSLLEINSTSKGVLLPRMSKTQRDNIFNPSTGLIIYQTNSTPGFYYYDGSGWVAITNKKVANTSLSNLTATTAINANLNPANDSATDIGSATKSWKNLYLDGSIYLNHTRFVTYETGTFSGNTAIGADALNPNTTGQANTAIGYSALYSNTEGENNTATGALALFGNTIGHDNTANGQDALFLNTSGYENTATGSKSLGTNNKGYDNTAHGYYTLSYNTTGNYNTANGAMALSYNTTGSNNTANGSQALYFNTEGQNNVATGNGAMDHNKTGSYNTATGSLVMYNNEQGSYNTASGFRALQSNTVGNSNTAIGKVALTNNITLSNLIAIGDSALYSLAGDTGHCTAVGSQAGWKNTSGNNNTYIGYHAGNTVTTGSSNTIIGYGADVNAATRINTTALGNGATATADNQVMLGNNAVTSVKAAGSFVIYSDGRYKKDLKENVPGLAFIRQLKPVTYHYDIHGMNQYMNVTAPDKNEAAFTETAITEKERKLYSGFVAQDVETVAKKLNYDFSGIYHPQNDKDLYGLSYADFVVPLVKAVQELSTQNDSLKNENASLRKDLNDLKNIVLSIQQRLQQGNTVSDVTSSSVQQHTITPTDAASLQQNVPNPFTNTTAISYSLPNKFLSAQIIITDKNGRSLKQISLSSPGKGTVHIDASTLSAGAYNYSLYVNGKLIATKQMILVK